MTLTKERIIEMFKSHTKLSAFESREAVEAILEVIKSRLEAGEDVKISGFGKWMVRKKTSRAGRNPHTGHKIEISARSVVTFQPSEKLRTAVDKSHLSDAKIARNVAEDDAEGSVSS